MTRKDDRRLQAVHHFHIIRPHLEEGVCQTEIARVSGIPLKTVQRWIRAYREAGIDGLVRKVRSDAGQARGLEQDLVLLIEGLALQSLRRPLTSIHALVSQVAQEQDWPPPRYGQVYRIVGQLPEDLVMLGRGAERRRIGTSLISCCVVRLGVPMPSGKPITVSCAFS